MAKELVLSEREELFIDALLRNGGKVKEAGEEAGYNSAYAYSLRKRLAKEIAKATQEYIAMHSPKAANYIIGSLDDENPNPVKLNAARDILDRAGAKPEEELNQHTVKANIFILPEKKYTELIDAKVIDHDM